MMTQAYDLFSGQYIEIDERKEFRSDREDAISKFQMQLIVDAWREVYGASIVFKPVPFSVDLRVDSGSWIWFDDIGLDSHRFDYKKPFEEIYHARYEIIEPNLGSPPAAKPDQPRHWVAMNQAPRGPRRKR